MTLKNQHISVYGIPAKNHHSSSI
ncbi:hypothetical protein F383_09439 [Gossypium arboreum]|uniref:Uncharacterized protein n=1 Tax=Gossypium arboreum TaxID=29729 RepID=A0A0B0PHA0_GOSAR|nr:hypothetical protein F383_09439 [Gossypium arboreum]